MSKVPLHRGPCPQKLPRACGSVSCTVAVCRGTSLIINTHPPNPPIGAIGALMNRVQQPRTLLVLGLNAGMSTAAGADELVEILTDVEHPIRTKAHPLLLIDES